MRITEEKGGDAFERLLYCEDDTTGLRAYIAIHSTLLGPAAGGCRMFPYPDHAAARADALRLARGMTFKNAAAGLDLGGGKAVIIADPSRDKTPALMQAFGRFVDTLKGSYYTAEDVGISVEDIEQVASVTPYAVGLSTGRFASGDPSPFTALGVFLSMQEAWFRVAGTRSLKGTSVAVQGLGHVGWQLASRLHQAGARLLVADIDKGRVAAACEEFDATAVDTAHIAAAPVDIYAPCAMGGALSPEVIADLKARLVCGAANNQLADDSCGAMLMARGITYAPDYVVNSGGIINVASEIFRIDDRRWVARKIDALAAFTGQILDQAREQQTAPNIIADQLVLERLANSVRQRDIA